MRLMRRGHRPSEVLDVRPRSQPMARVEDERRIARDGRVVEVVVIREHDDHGSITELAGVELDPPNALVDVVPNVRIYRAYFGASRKQPLRDCERRRLAR